MSTSALTIAAVERDTGLSKDLLRVWERRYGFPMPQRDATGERAYPPAQVARLRLVKRLIDGGHRPGRVLALADSALQALVAVDGQDDPPRGAHAAPAVPAQPLQPVLELLRTHDLAALQLFMHNRLQQLGVQNFVLQFAAPLQHAVADAWLHGQLQTFEQRACVQAALTALQAGLQTAGPDHDPASAPRLPRLLLTTLPGEPQIARLQLAQALLHDAGCHCIMLGAQLPIHDIAQAAAAYHADVVLVAFDDTLGANAVVHGLTDLRALLAADKALWVGGAARVLQRRRVPGVQALSLQDLLPQLTRWRDRPAP